MEKDVNQKELQEKQAVFEKLRGSDELFAILSACTREPYVHCDPETFDDEIWMFTDVKEAQEVAKRLVADKNPAGVARVEKAGLLLFYTSLFTMGVNAITLHEGGKKTRIQLSEFVKRKTQEAEDKGKIWVENPELHLTMLYYMQEFRKQPNPEITPRLADLQEEIGADFGKGRYIVAIPQEKQGIPLIKLKNGDVFQPVFTDVVEFQKFNREKNFRPAVVEAGKLAQVLPAEALGIILNPLGVNMALTVKKTAPASQPSAQPATVVQQVEAAMREVEAAKDE